MMTKKKVVVAGATGFIGKRVCGELLKRKHSLIVIARDIARAKQVIPDAFQYVDWKDSGVLDKTIDGAYGIINLSGAPIVGKRFTKEYKKVLFDSRILTTKAIVDAIAKAASDAAKTTIKPKVLINASAVGYYGYVPKEAVYQESDSSGSDFLAKLCVAWEKEAAKVEKYGVRVVCIRSAIVLGRHEGALPRMLTPFYYFVGGPIGSGKQRFPWIHVKDEVEIILFALENEKVTGPINAVSPENVTNKQFSSAIGKILHRPSVVPVPTLFLKLIFGEAAKAVTRGIKVSPRKIIQLGYKFQYPKLHQALADLLYTDVCKCVFFRLNYGCDSQPKL